MKRNKDKRSRGRFVTSILWKYFLFSIVFVLILICLFFAAVWNTGKYQGVPYMKELQKAFDGLAVNEYDSVDTDRILNGGGYVQILDENHRVLYSSDPAHSNESYTDYELNYIKNSDDFSLINVEEYEQLDGSIHQVVNVNSFTEEGKEVCNDIYVVDENLKILYSNTHKEKDRLTRREFQLLTDRISNRLSLSKAAITDAEGKEHTLLCYSTRSFKNIIGRVKRAYFLVAVVFLAVYVAAAFLFSLWIASRVKKPLHMLNSAMEKISEGDSGTVLNYYGPKEFVEICDNFNQMSQALDEANRRNKRLESQKQKMIADISHDLKTPITVIKGYSKAVADGMTAPSEQEKYLKTIYQRSSELADLIEEFHDYVKLEHPDSKMELETTDLSEFAREFFAEKYNEFDIGGYTLEADIAEKKIMVNLDRKKFRRVLDNITGNFFKYCAPGSMFYCGVEETAEQAVLILADNGKGIPKEIRDSVFDPFVVGEKSRASASSGSGLGLPLVKKIVEGHGGTIELAAGADENKIWAGDGDSEKTGPFATRFIIRLPKV